MSITFHCDYCGKNIKAPDNAGGKWNNCPSCNNKLYIPDLSQGNELKLAPIDETDEKKQKQLMAETYKLQQDILQQREEPAEQVQSVGVPADKVNDKQLMISIVAYLRQIADGQLEQAEQKLNTIINCGNRAVDMLDRIALSEIPEPELADIPPQVLSGLIKNLRGRIK